MNKTTPTDTYSDAETDARREAALKNLLATPPKPKKATNGNAKESSQDKG